MNELLNVDQVWGEGIAPSGREPGWDRDLPMRELGASPQFPAHPCGICFTEHETGAKALACCAPEEER